MKAWLLSFIILTTGMAQAQTVLSETDSRPVLDAVQIALTNQGQWFRSCEFTGYMNLNTSISLSTLIRGAKTVAITEGSQPVILAQGVILKWTDPNPANNHDLQVELEISTDSTFTVVKELVAVVLPRLLGNDRVNRGTITRPNIVEVPRFSTETRYQCL